jgi:DNA helicase-2/ATP-dependent DNA helicase PcrA
LEALLPWLCGDKSGGTSSGARQQNRLKIHYVAMTRPSHLLCLAMKRPLIENSNGESDRTVTGKLIHRGWKVKNI